MTKEELEKKRDQLANEIQIPHFAKSYSERAGHIASFKDGFDSAVALLLPRLEKAELKAKFIEQYLNPADTSFRQMIDTFKLLSEEKKQKLIKLTESLIDISEGNKND